MAVNQKPFWTFLGINFRNAVSRADKKVSYTAYLRNALMGAQVPRPSGVYTGHYSTGALYRSIKHKYQTSRVTKSKFSIKMQNEMLSYGYELSKGYISSAPSFAKLKAWVNKRLANSDPQGRITGRIYNTLKRGVRREGSGWIKDANLDYEHTFGNVLALESAPEVGKAAYTYVLVNLSKIFKQ